MNIVRCQSYDKGILINWMQINKKEDSLKSAWPLKEGKLLDVLKQTATLLEGLPQEPSGKNLRDASRHWELSWSFVSMDVGTPSYNHNWASLVAWTVKNLPAMQETWVQSLGWEDPLEEGMAIPLHYSCWRIPMDRGAWGTAVHGVTQSQTPLSK